MENQQTNVSLEHIQAMMTEVKDLFKETDKKFQATDKKFQASEKLLTEKFQATDKKFQEQWKKDKEQWKKDQAETKKLKEMIFGLGNNLGQITEDYFYNSVSSNKKVGGIQYDQILRNFKIEQKNMNAEYDIVLINSSRLLVIEVKQKPHINDIDKLVEKQLANFKAFFPYYADFKIYGGIAGMTFEPNVLTYAKANGLYILTQNQESKNMQLLNEKDFKAKEF